MLNLFSLGDEKYLGRFNKHYQAVMKYVSQGPMLLDVHMHRPYMNSKNFMDALLAFWPGLQVRNFVTAHSFRPEYSIIERVNGKSIVHFFLGSQRRY